MCVNVIFYLVGKRNSLVSSSVAYMSEAPEGIREKKNGKRISIALQSTEFQL
ncbi:hypothetical protein EXN66_Car015247 [Channa argus]|uniref:Uncharacterized protein n=1 Tax=Channa argus TaxID=215402 RepID=A0A6G1QA87_CHAAH|nr:hypothetical protein EXN66_Car015247 [Channa argus]